MVTLFVLWCVENMRIQVPSTKNNILCNQTL